MLSEIGFPTNGAFPINKPAMNNNIFLVAAVFHFIVPVAVKVTTK